MHSCTSCGKSFKFQSILSRHRDIHNPKFKVHCSCGSSFTRSDSLKRHQLKCIDTNNNLDTSDGDCSTEKTIDNHNEVKVFKPSGLLESSPMTEQLTTITDTHDIGVQTDEQFISKPQSLIKALLCIKSKSSTQQPKNTCDDDDSESKVSSDAESDEEIKPSPLLNKKRKSKSRISQSRSSNRVDD